ncbi:MAG: MFS transporter [Candidatus Omnitrophica bacterium]|nr:MFS transporter [Candidatus Omnitrophota bacterium]
MKFILRALRSRNYRLFFMGQGISLIGSWMQLLAVSWLVYRLTDSAFILGLVAFSSQAPSCFLSPFAGVLADRWNRKYILIVTQGLAAVQALALAILAFSGSIQVWQIVFLSLLMGFINAFDAPVRQAFVIDLVEKEEDLNNAIALNSLIFNSAKLFGASLAGIFLALVGEGMCFLINAFSFLAVIFALVAMKIKVDSRRVKDKHVLRELKEGFLYVVKHPSIRYILMLVTLISVTGMPYMVLMPIVAQKTLAGGAHTLGFLMGASGLGALAAGIYLARRQGVAGLERIIFYAALIFGGGLVAFSFSRSLYISLLLLPLVGFGMITQMVSSNTLLQTLSEHTKRGRVMSFYIIAFMGMTPFGSLFAGGLAAKIGASATILISGLCSIAGALLFGSRLRVMRKNSYPITKH